MRLLTAYRRLRQVEAQTRELYRTEPGSPRTRRMLRLAQRLWYLVWTGKAFNPRRQRLG